MIAKELQDWFPEAQISDQPVEKEGYLTLPLASQQWLLLEKSSLLARYDADPLSQLPNSVTGWSSGLCFRAATR